MKTVSRQIAILVDPVEEKAVGPVGYCGEDQEEICIGDEGKKGRDWVLGVSDGRESCSRIACFVRHDCLWGVQDDGSREECGIVGSYRKNARRIYKQRNKYVY